MISAGSQAFAAIVQRLGGPEVAKRLKVTRGAAHNWARGRRLPSPASRRRVAKTYGVPFRLWDAEAPLAPSSDATAREPSSSVQTNDRDPVAVCLDAIRQLRHEIEQLDSQQISTSKDRAQMAWAFTEGLVEALRSVPGACAAADEYFRGRDG